MKINLIKISLLILLSINTILSNKNNQQDLNDNPLITKEQFLKFYNEFFVESNGMPEIADLYKDDPDFFKSLGEKLSERLPEKFPLNYIKDIFDKDKILATIEEMKSKNISLEDFNQKQKEEIAQKVKLEEERIRKEEEKKKEEILKKKKEVEEKLKEKMKLQNEFNDLNAPRIII